MNKHFFQPLNLIVPFWKPTDWTSFDVVKKVRNQVKPNKVGHTGTLDPFAEGVLVLCIGNKTKESDKIMSLRKEYICTIQLGVETDTLDSTGKIIKKLAVPKISKEKLNSVLAQFIGDSFQIPPMYSAIKKNGIPLYKLARRGIKVGRKPRLIHIYDIELLNLKNCEIILRVQCGKGTYIRSLAKNISEKLNTCGHLTNLSRIRVGNYLQSESIKIENLNEWLSTIA